MPQPTVMSGLDVLAEGGLEPLRNRRVGLVANPAAVDARLRHAADLLSAESSVRLAALFGPEHGFGAEAQDLIGVPDCRHPRYDCPIHSLYGETAESLRPGVELLRGLDALVIDLPDIGSRYYTFQATMLYCLEAAAAVGLSVFVLDRPNPLDGESVEGATVRPGYESFVGAHPIPIRHGMTLGELARLCVSERRMDVALQVVKCRGWERHQYFDETGLTWVMPSPNMPSLDTAIVYPGQCLLEGTNLSEGRGTTRPFELCGAPWIDSYRLVSRLEAREIPGALFRPIQFRPTFHKFAGQVCGGIQVHVLDRSVFRPVRTGLEILVAFRAEDPDKFRWRTEPYEFVQDPPAIDLLFGSSRERLAIEAGLPVEEISTAWAAEEQAFRARREPYLLY